MQYHIPAGHGFFDLSQGAAPATIALITSLVLDSNGTTTSPFLPRRIVPLATTASPLILGTYTGPAMSGVAFSWQGGAFVTGTNFQLDWNGPGTWRATFPGQVAGDGTLIVRETNNTAVTATSLLAIGDPLGIWGDSRTLTRGNLTMIASSVPAYVWFGPFWMDSRLINWTGYQWTYFLEQLRAFTGRPSFLLGPLGPYSGTNLLADWAPGGSTYASFLAQYEASGIDALSFLLAMIGVNDLQPPGSGGAASESALAAGLQATANALQAAVAGSPKTFFDIAGVRAYSPWTGGASDTDFITAFNGLRAATIDAVVADPAACAVGANTTGHDYTDHMHWDTDAHGINIGQRFWLPVKAAYYGGTAPGRGPKMVRAQYTADQRTVYCDFDQTLSTADGGTIVGISISATGSTPSITAATKTGSRRATLTLSAPFSGVLTVRFAYAVDAAPGTDTINLTTLPFGPMTTLDEQTRSSAIALPAEPQFGLTASLFTAAPMGPASVGLPALAAYRDVVMV